MFFTKLMQKSFGGRAASSSPITDKKGLDLHNTPGIFGGGQQSFVGFLFQNGNSDLAFFMLLRYYETCAPFADAVDTIAQELASVPIRLWDKNTEEYITDHPVLDFLRFPNAETTQTEFMFRLAAIYLITGNVFPVLTGFRDSSVQEMNMFSPHQVNLFQGGDGMIGRISLNPINDQELFTRDEDNNRVRFFNSTETAEILPIRRFNPRRDANHLYGLSKADALIYEIEQYVHSSQHNLSLLKNGARPSGSFTTNNEHPLSDDQFTRLDEQITKYYQGSANAGRPLLLENATWTDHIVTNKDMDYATMRKGIMEMIYARYDIPLSLITTSSMTYDNYESGRVALYDSAVLPLAKTLFENLAILLLPRFEQKDFMRYEFRYEEADIPALELRRVQKIKLRREIGVNTVNEMRKFLGDEQLEGGDVLLRPSNELPVAMDLYTEDEVSRTNTPRNPNEPDETRNANVVEFKSVLKSYKKSDGSRMYSDAEIEQKAKDYGIS